MDTSQGHWSRRVFLKVTGCATLAQMVACGMDVSGGLLGDGSTGKGGGGGAIAFRRTGRGLRTSKASKLHCANRLYATEEAAWSDPAHPGDKATVVPVTISRELYDELFAGGYETVDLRWFYSRSA